MQTRVDLTITFGARIILVVKGGLPALIMLTAPVWQDVNLFFIAISIFTFRTVSLKRFLSIILV